MTVEYYQGRWVELREIARAVARPARPLHRVDGVWQLVGSELRTYDPSKVVVTFNGTTLNGC